MFTIYLRSYFHLRQVYVGLLLFLVPLWVKAVEIKPSMCRMLAPPLAEKAHIQDLVPLVKYQKQPSRRIQLAKALEDFATNACFMR